MPEGCAQSGSFFGGPWPQRNQRSHGEVSNSKSPEAEAVLGFFVLGRIESEVPFMCVDLDQSNGLRCKSGTRTLECFVNLRIIGVEGLAGELERARTLALA